MNEGGLEQEDQVDGERKLTERIQVPGTFEGQYENIIQHILPKIYLYKHYLNEITNYFGETVPQLAISCYQMKYSTWIRL